MELGVSHVQNLSSLTPIVDNIFDKYNKNLVPIRSHSDHDTKKLTSDNKKMETSYCDIWCKHKLSKNTHTDNLYSAGHYLLSASFYQS